MADLKWKAPDDLTGIKVGNEYLLKFDDNLPFDFKVCPRGAHGWHGIPRSQHDFILCYASLNSEEDAKPEKPKPKSKSSSKKDS